MTGFWFGILMAAVFGSTVALGVSLANSEDER